MSNRIQVNVTRGITNVVQVNTAGPKGEKGETGDTGANADPNAISGSLHLTGSLTVSSSNVDFSNATSITGSTFSGSLFIGSFQGNGSQLTAITASQQPSGPNTSVQFRDSTDNSGSSDFTFDKTTGNVFIGGALTASVAISSSGTITANALDVGNGRIYGSEVNNTYLDFNASSSLFKIDNKTYIKFDGSSAQLEVTVNEGTNDIDFVVKGASNNPLFKTDSATNTIGMHGVGTPEADLHLGGNLKTNSHITASGNISSSAELLGNDVRVNNVLYIESKRVNVTNNDLTIVDTGLNVLGGPITASIISASGDMFANQLSIDGEIALSTSGTDTLILGNSNTFTTYQYGRNDTDNHTFKGHITSSGAITVVGNISSSSGNVISRKFQVPNSDSNDGIIFDSLGDKPTFHISNSKPSIGQGHPSYLGVGLNIHTTGSDGTKGLFIDSVGNVTASGDISSSASVIGLTGSFGRLEGLSPITVGDSITFTQAVTASGDISSSGAVVGLSGSFTKMVGTVGDEINLNRIGVGSIGNENTPVTSSYIVTVATKTQNHPYYDVGSALGYLINGIESPYLNVYVGRSYKFDQSDSSNNTHPLRFYLDVDKTTQYTTNVTYGEEPTYTQISITEDTPRILYYQCSAHNNMGNAMYVLGNQDGQFNGAITAGGNISSSATITANEYKIHDKTVIQRHPSNGNPEIGIGTEHTLISGTNIKLDAPVTASGDISSSATITANAFSGGGAGITGVVSSSYALTASFALNSSGGVPAGTLSSSAQIASDISGSFTAISASFSTRVTANEAGGGGGSGIFVATGSIHSTTNDLRITGSVFIDDTSTAAGSGDANAVFKVKGTEGNLITVTNNLTNLLDVKDVSGVSVFQVSGSGEVIMKDLPTTQPTTTGSLWISGSGTPPGAAGSGYLMIFVG
jgi:hypothetical protein